MLSQHVTTTCLHEPTRRSGASWIELLLERKSSVRVTRDRRGRRECHATDPVRSMPGGGCATCVRERRNGARAFAHWGLRPHVCSTSVVDSARAVRRRGAAARPVDHGARHKSSLRDALGSRGDGRANSAFLQLRNRCRSTAPCAFRDASPAGRVLADLAEPTSRRWSWERLRSSSPRVRAPRMPTDPPWRRRSACSIGWS
jgi:hypothetical protein